MATPLLSLKINEYTNVLFVWETYNELQFKHTLKSHVPVKFQTLFWGHLDGFGVTLQSTCGFVLISNTLY